MRLCWHELGRHILHGELDMKILPQRIDPSTQEIGANSGQGSHLFRYKLARHSEQNWPSETGVLTRVQCESQDRFMLLGNLTVIGRVRSDVTPEL